MRVWKKKKKEKFLFLESHNRRVKISKLFDLPLPTTIFRIPVGNISPEKAKKLIIELKSKYKV